MIDGKTTDFRWRNLILEKKNVLCTIRHWIINNKRANGTIVIFYLEDIERTTGIEESFTLKYQ